MNFTLERITQPSLEPVLLSEAKIHLSELASVTDKDDWITELIVGAREWVENETGRALVDQTWRLNVGDNYSWDTRGCICGTVWPSSAGLYLMRSPILSIIGVASVDSDGVTTAVDSGDYTLIEANSKWPRILGLSASTSYRITFRAGYADRTGSPTQGREVIPTTYKTAIKLHIEAMYDRDEKMMPLLLDTAKRIVHPERCHLQIA